MFGKKILTLAIGTMMIGAGCGAAPTPPAPVPSTSQEAVYVLTALADTTAYDRAPVPTTFGCQDRLMLQRVEVPRSSRPALEVNLNTMFAVRYADAEKLGLHTPFGGQQVRATVTEEDGKTIVDIAPYPISAGTCDDPRIREMIEETARLTLGSVPEIRIEGSKTQWRCHGDQSGLCR